MLKLTDIWHFYIASVVFLQCSYRDIKPVTFLVYFKGRQQVFFVKNEFWELIRFNWTDFKCLIMLNICGSELRNQSRSFYWGEKKMTSQELFLMFHYILRCKHNFKLISRFLSFAGQSSFWQMKIKCVNVIVICFKTWF